MQRDPIQRPSAETENIGDVLASIRRLIAQDQAERQQPAAQPERQPPFQQPAPLHALGTPPRVLAPHEQVAGVDPIPAAAALSDAPDPVLSPEDEAELAEAEAILARMVAPPRIAPAEPVPEEAPAWVAPAPESAAPPETGEGSGSGAEIMRLPVLNLFAPAEGEEPSLRELIREVLHQELEGELGLRVSRQLQQLVRREVEAVIREICAEA